MGRQTLRSRGLIVSCQALGHEPLHGGDTMSKMALSARQSGAVGIRTNGVQDIRRIKQAVDLPVIGLIKREMPGSSVFITPTPEEVAAILEAGADIVAMDITDREGRLDAVPELIAMVHQAGAAVMADISTYEEGIAAERLGADFIGTTLSGYTPYSPQREEPDFELVRRLSERVKCPVVAEGRIWTPEDAVKALACGADYVVVGSAITRPQLIVERYVHKISEWLSRSGNVLPGQLNENLYNPYSPYAIGIDVGGTKINLGVIDRQGEVVVSYSLPTMDGKAKVIDRIEQGIDQLLERAGHVKPGIAFKGLGVGTAGQVDWHQGSIRYASGLLPEYTGTEIKALLQAKLGLPVYVDNDVNVLALAEQRFGSGKGKNQMVCLALGTGVGGALIVDGKIVRGAWGGAGEIGHMSVNFRGPACICGNTGCLEQYASGKGMERLMRERLAAEEPRNVNPAIDAKEIVARWLSGDAAAREVMDEVIAALGTAVAGLIHIFNPEIVVIGGGVADTGEPFISRIREDAAGKTMPSLYEGVRIEASYRGNLSGAIGAAILVWHSAQDGREPPIDCPEL